MNVSQVYTHKKFNDFLKTCILVHSSCTFVTLTNDFAFSKTMITSATT